jgi:hypothetical protein
MVTRMREVPGGSGVSSTQRPSAVHVSAQDPHERPQTGSGPQTRAPHEGWHWSSTQPPSWQV